MHIKEIVVHSFKRFTQPELREMLIGQVRTSVARVFGDHDGFGLVLVAFHVGGDGGGLDRLGRRRGGGRELWRAVAGGEAG